jgi:hypothetical protein
VAPSVLPVVVRFDAVFPRLRPRRRSRAAGVFRVLSFVTRAPNVARGVVAAVARLGERHSSAYTAGDGEDCCNENLRDR